MKSLWEAGTRREILGRIDALSPQAEPAWGRMRAPQMLAHLSDAVRMAFGDIVIPPRRVPLRYTPIRQLLVYWVPIPRGFPTAPELIAREAYDWSAERDACAALLQRFATESRSRGWPEHPALGPLTARQWGVLTYRHLDHHLRQFGV